MLALFLPPLVGAGRSVAFLKTERGGAPENRNACGFVAKKFCMGQYLPTLDQHVGNFLLLGVAANRFWSAAKTPASVA